MLTTMIAMAILRQGPRPDAVCVDLQGNRVVPLNRMASPLPKATVLIFYLAHCPIAQKMTPEINRLYKEFTPKGIRFYMIHEDATLSDKDVKSQAEAFGLLPQVLIDKWKTQMKVSGAVTSPEAFVYNSEFRMTYRGRISDLFYGLGRMRPSATKRDLRDGILATLAGQAWTDHDAPAVGCILPKN
jgi:hypothetical protein